MFKIFSDLSHKVAVVTGGSKGLGSAIARRFGKENMKVVINYHTDAAGAQQTAEQVIAAGGQAITVQADVSTENGIHTLCDMALQTFGDLDVWVNNAGMENQHATHQLTLAEWQRVINVNLTGVFLGTQTALNYFVKKNKTGNIINMSSVHEQIPWPMFAHYAASKGGIKLFIQTVAMEYAARHIRINAIGPGAINTPINAVKFADQ